MGLSCSHNTVFARAHCTCTSLDLSLPSTSLAVCGHGRALIVLPEPLLAH